MSENGDRPELPEGWEWRRLGEVLDIKYGKGLPARNRTDGPVPVYSSAGKTGSHDVSLIDGPVLVIARKGVGIGDTFLAPGACWVIDTAYYAAVPEDCEPSYLLHLLNAKRLKRLDSSSAIPSLKRDDLAEVRVALPPREEQRRIVERIEERLAKIDNAVEALDLAGSGLGNYDRVLIREALAGHPLVSLGEVCEVRSGYGFSKTLQGRPSGDIPFAKVRDISETLAAGSSQLNRANHYVSRGEAAEHRMKPFPAGTVAMAKIGEAVRLNRRVTLGTEALLDNNVMGWVPDETLIRPEWLRLVSAPMRLGDISRATTVPSVRKSDVVALRINLPSLADQDRLLRVLEERRSARQALAEEVAIAKRRADRLKVSVLAAALRGGA